MIEEKQCDKEPIDAAESPAPSGPARSDEAPGNQGKKLIKKFMTHDGVFRATFED